MELRQQATRRFINDVCFGAAADAETLILVCECGRPACHEFVNVPRAVFAQLLPTPSPRVLTTRCARGEERIAAAASPYAPSD